MSIEKTTVVDWLGLEKETGAVILTVVDDSDWSDEQEHLRLLQAKLNTYLAFIESGEVFEHLTNERGRAVSKTTPIKVLIVAKHDPPPTASEFLAHAVSTFRAAGFSLAYQVFRVGDRLRAAPGMQPAAPARDDWRRRGQERFLKGRHWSHRSYRPYREGWDHDHCEFCGAKLSLRGGDLQRGYVSDDNYHWVCEPCFADFQNEMEWTVEVM